LILIGHLELIKEGLLMTRLRLLRALLLVLVIPVFAIPHAAAKAAVAASAQHAPVVAAQVGSGSGVQKAASEGLPLLGLGAALILGASLMRRLAPVRTK
jgi:hypothetical protein